MSFWSFFFLNKRGKRQSHSKYCTIMKQLEWIFCLMNVCGSFAEGSP